VTGTSQCGPVTTVTVHENRSDYRCERHDLRGLDTIDLAIAAIIDDPQWFERDLSIDELAATVAVINDGLRASRR